MQYNGGNQVEMTQMGFTENQGGFGNNTAINPQLAMMNAGIPGMTPGVMPTPGLIHNTFNFAGTALALQARLDGLTNEEVANIVDARVTVTGNLLQGMNTCCFMATIMATGFCLLPGIIMCFDCWKRCVYPSWEVPETAYRSLAKLIRAPRMQNLTLVVTDNFFGRNAATVLCDMISGSNLRGFTFSNNSMQLNYKDSNYSDFETYMKPLKKLPLVTSLYWGNDIVL